MQGRSIIYASQTLEPFFCTKIKPIQEQGFFDILFFVKEVIDTTWWYKVYL